jgi:aspartate/methionine/tyrosine aminotransferase
MMESFDLSRGTIAPSLANEAEAWKAPFLAYGPRGGFPYLRSILAEKEGVTPECVIVTSGASMALSATLALLPKNQAVLMPRPYYPAYPNVANFLGLEVVYYEIGPDRSLAEAVSGAASGRTISAILVNTPGNPRGNLATVEDMNAIEKVANGAKAVLIVDETYAGILLDPATRPWCGSGVAAGIVRLKSLSKAYLLAGERIGYALAQPGLAGKIEEAHWVLAMSPSVTAQANAARALMEDNPERLARLCALLRRSRDSAVAVLASVAALEIPPPLAGVFLWIPVSGSCLTGVDIAHHCRESHGLMVMPGEACGQIDPPAIRASFALSEVEVTQAFHSLGKALYEMGSIPVPRTARRDA